jgi:hypothetical protein
MTPPDSTHERTLADCIVSSSDGRTDRLASRYVTFIFTSLASFPGGRRLSYSKPRRKTDFQNYVVPPADADKKASKPPV